MSRRLAAGGAFLGLAVAVSSCDSVRTPRTTAVVDNRPAYVSFLSNPGGASVRLNGKLLEGTTPIEVHEVPAGLSVIEYEKEGYLPARAQHRWRAGEVARLDLHLAPIPTPTPRRTFRERTPRRTAEPPPPLPVRTRPRRRTTPPTPAAAPTEAPTRPPTAVIPKTASVTLVTKPPGASVTVNGEALQGVTPLNAIVLPAGKATVEFHLENYEPASVDRAWEPGAEDAVTVDLVGLPARLSIYSTPAGATVKVGDVIVEGETPIDGALVPPGENQVSVELENHLPYVERKTLAPNADIRIDAELKPMDASVRFESEPPGATVIVNNKTLPDTAPIGPLSMPPGHVRVEFQLAGHAVRVVERDWAPNGVDVVMAKLAPNPGRAQFESSVPWDALAVDGKAVAVTPGGWLPLMAGPHRVLAQRQGGAAETQFVVPPGGDVVVALNWANKRPPSTDFTVLPGVRATLGAERFADSNPVHEVDVAGFWMARREVTVDEYRACVDAGRCPEPGSGDGCNWKVGDRGEHPINCVNAKDAEAYAAWRAERDEIPYRLPTTDEWERAARGAGDRPFPWGEEPVGARCNTCDRSCTIERFRDEEFNDGRPETAPVGVLAYCASKEGVLDLVGNVAEWTRVGAEGETFQVRGGSWAQNGIFLDPALAVPRPPTDRDPTIGFRLVVSSDALPHLPPPTATPADTPTAVEAAPEPTTAPAQADMPTSPEPPPELQSDQDQ